MAIGTGLAAQFGMVAEASYGTYLAPSRFVEFDRESIKAEVKQVMSRGLGRARTQRGAQVRTYVAAAAGDVDFDVMTVGFGLLLKGLLGAVATTGVADPYTHTFTPDANGLQGQSWTVQVGRPDVSGVVQPFTYTGGKVTKAKLSAQLDQALKLTTSWDFQGEDTSRALAAKSYGAGANPLIFVDGSLQFGGVTQFIKSVELSIDNGLNIARRGLGNVKREPLPNNELAVMGSFDLEFEGLTRHGQLTAGTTVNTVQLNFMYGTHGLQVTIPQLIYTPGGEPTVGGPDIVDEKMPWKAVDDGVNPLLTLKYLTADATP